MATKLKNLRISKVDFVDEGANPDAHIKLTQSASIPRTLRYICFCRASSIVFLMRHPLHRRSLLRNTR